MRATAAYFKMRLLLVHCFSLSGWLAKGVPNLRRSSSLTPSCDTFVGHNSSRPFRFAPRIRATPNLLHRLRRYVPTPTRRYGCRLSLRLRCVKGRGQLSFFAGVNGGRDRSIASTLVG